MKIEVNLKKKYFFSILAVAVIILSILGAYALWDNTKTVWHSGNDLKITLSGQDYSLQEAINLGLIGNGSTTVSGSNIRIESGSVMMLATTATLKDITFSQQFKGTPIVKLYHNYISSPTTVSPISDYLSNGFYNVNNNNYYGIWANNVSKQGFKLYTSNLWSYPEAVNVTWVAIGESISSSASGITTHIDYNQCVQGGGVTGSSCGFRCPDNYVLVGFQTGASCGYPPANGDTLWQTAGTCCKLV